MTDPAPVVMPYTAGPCDTPEGECPPPESVDPDTWARVRAVAAYRLWLATGQRFGMCPRSADVCGDSRGCCGRATSNGCSCATHHYAIALPDGATAVTLISDPATGDDLDGWAVNWGRQEIYRADPWPSLVAVDYETGTPWPMDAGAIIDQYAASLARSWCPTDGTGCDLPTGVKVMSRDGVEYMIEADRDDDLTPGETGLVPVDDWVRNVGTGSRPTIWTQARAEQQASVMVTA